MAHFNVKGSKCITMHEKDFHKTLLLLMMLDPFFYACFLNKMHEYLLLYTMNVCFYKLDLDFWPKILYFLIIAIFAQET